MTEPIPPRAHEPATRRAYVVESWQRGRWRMECILPARNAEEATRHYHRMAPFSRKYAVRAREA